MITKPFLVLKDFECAVDQIVAHGKSTIPRTVQTPEYPTISVWLRTSQEPITIMYESEEEREADLINLREAINQERTYPISTQVN